MPRKDKIIMGLSCSVVEISILMGILKGQDYKHIAETRCVSEQAVKECMKRFFHKNNLKNKESLFIYLLNQYEVTDNLVKQLLEQL